MSYDLDETTVRRLVANALATHTSATGRFVALAVGPATPLADVARTVEREVFEVEFALDAATMAAEYRQYEADSLFFVVLDRKTGLPAGAARMIDGGGKTLDDAPDIIDTPLSTIVALHDLHNGRIWDFATIAVLPALPGEPGRADRQHAALPHLPQRGTAGGRTPHGHHAGPPRPPEPQAARRRVRADGRLGPVRIPRLLVHRGPLRTLRRAAAVHRCGRASGSAAAPSTPARSAAGACGACSPAARWRR